MKKIVLFCLGLILVVSACVVKNKPAENLPANIKPAALSPEKILPTQAEVPILIYHHIKPLPTSTTTDTTFIVTPESFEAQITYLKQQGFNSILFKDLVNYFEGNFDLPEKPIIISFDDGVINQYENAWPILQKNNIKATFFIFVNPIGKSQNYMSWEQLGELVEAGMEIGSHGWYHLYLNRVGPAELQKELVDSKKILEERLNAEVQIVAYPFGEYDEKIKQAVKDAGYKSARDITNGATHTPESLYGLKGYFVTNNFSQFKSILN